MAPGTVSLAHEAAPLSTIGRIKSAKALAAAEKMAAANGASGEFDGQAYLRGVKGQLEDMDRLLKLDWTQDLLAQPGVQTLLSCGAMSKAPDPQEINGIDADHMFLTFLRQDLVRDLMFLWDSQQHTFHTLISIGIDVCGHPRIVHGGFTSAIIDETTGGLVFELKKAGELGPGPAFTARLEVDYKAPVPASADVVCTARVEKVEGRKCWTVAEVRDRPGGVLYAVGRALYVTPRSAVESTA